MTGRYRLGSDRKRRPASSLVTAWNRMAAALNEATGPIQVPTSLGRLRAPVRLPSRWYPARALVQIAMRRPSLPAGGSAVVAEVMTSSAKTIVCSITHES